jgi:hypothetical protein
MKYWKGSDNVVMLLCDFEDVGLHNQSSTWQGFDDWLTS